MTSTGMLVLTALAALATGCATTEPDQSALLSIAIVGPNADARWVSGSISNVSDVKLFHSPCFAELQHRQAGEWTRVDPEATCPLPLQTLEPGAQVEFSVGPRQASFDCDYRVVATLHASYGSEGAGETVTALSERFCFR